MTPKYDLLTKRRFLPLFITQFLGAFNDNLMRNGLVTLVAFNLLAAQRAGVDPHLVIVMAPALLVAPYIIFSALAGELADRYERSRLMRYTKFFELGVMLLAAYGFWTDNIVLLMSLLFLAGIQATFFSPMKYSVLPDHLHKDELITGNGFIEGGTFLAILLGSILGIQLGKYIDIDVPVTSLYVSAGLIVFSIIGIITSYFIPRAEAASPNLHVHKNIFVSTWKIIKIITRDKPIFYAVIANSWFWLMGSVLMSQFPIFGREVMYANENVYTIFLAVFSVGVAIGAVATGRILKGQITARLAPKALFGMSACIIFMLVAVQFSHKPSEEVVKTDQLIRSKTLTEQQTKEAIAFVNDNLLSTSEFFSHAGNIGVLLGIFGISFFGGLYSVPLKAVLQTKANEKERSRVIAGDNIFNAVYMVLSGAFVIILNKLGLDVVGIFAVICALNLAYMLLVKSWVRIIG